MNKAELVLGCILAKWTQMRSKKFRKLLLAFPRTSILGHRGSPAKAVENTIPSFVQAMEDGADGVEFDIQMSEDGIPCVFHDRNLMRLAGDTRNIDQCLYSDLARLTLNSDSKTQEAGISTLDQVLSIFKNGAVVNIELKETVLLQSPRAIEAIIEHAAPHENRLQLVYSSFSLDTLQAFHAVKPEAVLGFVLDRKTPLYDFFRLYRLGLPIAFIHPHESLVSKGTANLIQSLGVFLIVWGKNIERLQRLRRGQMVRGIISDHPEYFLS